MTAKGLTDKEKECLGHLASFWNCFLALPDISKPHFEDDVRNVRDAVHVIQDKIAFRVAMRIDSDFWSSGGGDCFSSKG